MDKKLLIIELNREFEIIIENCVRRVLGEILDTKIRYAGINLRSTRQRVARTLRVRAQQNLDESHFFRVNSVSD